MTQIMKAIAIIGPNLANYRTTDIMRNKYSSIHGLLLVGDGAKNITSHDIQHLHNKIDANTRIDIFMHGLIDERGSHLLQTSAYDMVATWSVLRALSEAVDGAIPLHVHLWSCYAGAASVHINDLPIHSTLITHAYSDASVYDLIYAYYWLRPDTPNLGNPIAVFNKEWLLSSLSGSIISTTSNFQINGSPVDIANKQTSKSTGMLISHKTSNVVVMPDLNDLSHPIASLNEITKSLNTFNADHNIATSTQAAYDVFDAYSFAIISSISYFLAYSDINHNKEHSKQMKTFIYSTVEQRKDFEPECADLTTRSCFMHIASQHLKSFAPLPDNYTLLEEIELGIAIYGLDFSDDTLNASNDFLYV